MADQSPEKVGLGTWAKVSGTLPDGEQFEDVFHFVPNGDVELVNNKISLESPLGRVLTGATAGDEVTLSSEKGPVALTVLEVGAG
jgi:transcription elongation GreA/GreB family factor